MRKYRAKNGELYVKILDKFALYDYAKQGRSVKLENSTFNNNVILNYNNITTLLLENVRQNTSLHIPKNVRKCSLKISKFKDITFEPKSNIDDLSVVMCKIQNPNVLLPNTIKRLNIIRTHILFNTCSFDYLQYISMSGRPDNTYNM